MIDRMKLRTKIAALVIAALLGLISMVVLSAIQVKRDLLDGRQKVIQSVLEGVISTVEAVEKPIFSRMFDKGMAPDSSAPFVILLLD